MRDVQADRVDRQFVDRWSTRKYTTDSVDPEDLKAVFEAARWAPSSFNAQPWVIVHSTSDEERDRIASVLNERNAAWAATAPHLAILFARKRFEHNDRKNQWAAFDTGAAWMSMALQAHLLGYSAHAMAGFDAGLAYEVSGLDPEDVDVLCVVAIGRPADMDDETRSPRKAPESIIRKPEAS